ncbi:hypothetical protein EH228_05115 [Erwinia endophytica]|uniref:hypothetical protein n=1 Tax=Erwinia endophytica TaxID=1563158 RepID=UPI001265F991|nr:hypothetical protein [Erwinia endophytica]KAB8312870.1 hypothetical protein EH228_05115 [Erwinia endophytica]
MLFTHSISIKNLAFNQKEIKIFTLTAKNHLFTRQGYSLRESNPLNVGDSGLQKIFFIFLNYSLTDKYVEGFAFQRCFHHKQKFFIFICTTFHTILFFEADQ